MSTLIVGAGYAGLSAAFELAKAGKSFVLVEKEDRLGGNSRGFVIDGEKLDPGVIVFYEWYYAFLEMMSEISPEMKINFKNKPNRYGFMLGMKTGEILNDQNLRKKLYNEQFDTWSERSLMSVHRDISYIRNLLTVGTISFGYPDPNSLNASIMSPIFLRNHLGVVSCLGVVDIINAIHDYIRFYGRILTSTSIMTLNPPTLSTGEKLKDINNVVLTCGVGKLHRQIVPSLARITYTKLYAVIIELTNEPPSFLDGHNRCINDVCVLYLINYNNKDALASLNCVAKNNLKIVGISDRFHRSLNRESISNTVQSYFGNTLVGIIDVVQYENTMPIIHPSDINKLQKNQGTVSNGVNYYFAGQYLSYPSVESACYTGRLAGKRIANPDDAYNFQNQYDKIDEVLEQEFTRTYQNFNIMMFLLVLILLQIVAYMVVSIRNNAEFAKNESSYGDLDNSP